MFQKVIKLVLALVSVAYAVYQFIESYIGNGIFMLLLAGMFILLYFKNEIIFLAFHVYANKTLKELSGG